MNKKFPEGKVKEWIKNIRAQRKGRVEQKPGCKGKWHIWGPLSHSDANGTECVIEEGSRTYVKVLKNKRQVGTCPEEIYFLNKFWNSF